MSAMGCSRVTVSTDLTNDLLTDTFSGIWIRGIAVFICDQEMLENDEMGYAPGTEWTTIFYC